MSSLLFASSLLLSACNQQNANSDSDTSQEPNSTEALISYASDNPIQVDTALGTDGWRPLFNGRDLTGWATTVGMFKAWDASHGELVTIQPGEGDWLFTKEKFTDFELTLEFFLPAEANTGVGLRVAEVGDPGYGGYEIQLKDSAGQPPTNRNAGAIFDIAPAQVMAIHPANQWNTLRVKLVGQTLDVWLNDQHIHDALPLPPLPDRDPFISGEELTGQISIQDNGGSARFRNIRIRVLNEPSDGAFSLDRLNRR